eukprot:12979813-Ditylum_brightwellii.AAC.1
MALQMLLIQRKVYHVFHQLFEKEKAAKPIGLQNPGVINVQPCHDPHSAKSLSVASMGRGGGGGKATSQMQSCVVPPEYGTTPATTTPTTNDNKNYNRDTSEIEQNNKDNADTEMNLAYDNCNDDDKNGNNNKMDEQKNEEDLTTAEDGEN